MRNQDLEKQLTTPSKILALRSSEKASHFCLVLIVFVVAMILIFVAQKDYQLSSSMVLIQSHSSLEVSGNQVQDHSVLFR